MGILMLRSSGGSAPEDSDTTGALRILPGSSADYGYARLDTIPNGFGDGEFTLEIWVKATTGLTVASTASTKTSRWSSDNETIYGDPEWWFLGNFLLDGHNNNTYENGTLSVQIVNSGRVRWLFGDGAAAGTRTGDLHAAQGSTSVIDGNWHCIHLVRRWDGGTGAELELWVDGVLEDMETSTARTNMASTYWDNMTSAGYPAGERNWMFGAEKIAALGGAQWEHYMGLIDRVRFYNRAADEAELEALQIDSGLVGGYEFTEGTGTSVADSEGGTALVLVDSDQYEWVTDDEATAALVHGASFVVTGSGFGSKTTYNGLLWDDCSHGESVATRYSGGWPNASTAGYNINYRTPAAVGRGVALPHSNITSYLCGAHYNDGETLGSGSAYNVAVWRSYTRPSLPYYTVWSWYERIDPNWTYDSGSDGNYKFFDFSTGGTLYDGNNNWYIANNAGEVGEMDGPSDPGMTWLINDDLSGGGAAWTGWANIGFGNGYILYGTSPQSGWVKREVIIRHDNSSGGTAFVVGYNNNTTGTKNAAGSYTDDYSGTSRSEGIGGYSRNYPDADNWRYFADIYNDRSTNPGRFYLANNATLSSATIREIQPYTSWSDTSVSLTCNKGALSSGTVHLHYRNEVGTPQYLGTRVIS